MGDPVFRGNVNAAKHHVVVIDTAVERERSPESRLEMGKNVTGSKLSALVAATDHGVRRFDDGEFIEWHKGPSGVSILWSSDLIASELVGKAQQVLGHGRTTGLGTIEIAGEPVSKTKSAAEVVGELSVVASSSVEKLEMDLPMASVGWSSRPGTAELRESSDRPEAAVFFTPDKSASIQTLIAKTATKAVRAVAREVVIGATSTVD